MSWINCIRCGGMFDTDDDPDCWVIITHYRSHDGPMARAWYQREEPMCEQCREEIDD